MRRLGEYSGLLKSFAKRVQGEKKLPWVNEGSDKAKFAKLIATYEKILAL